MLELIQATVKRSLLYKDPNFAWLLALLSSSTIFATYPNLLHSSILSQIVDRLHCCSLDKTANVLNITEVVIYVGKTMAAFASDAFVFLYHVANKNRTTLSARELL